MDTEPECVRIHMFSLEQKLIENTVVSYYKELGFYNMPVSLVDWSQVSLFENGTVIHCYTGVMPMDWAQLSNVFECGVFPRVYNLPKSMHVANHPHLQLW